MYIQLCMEPCQDGRMVSFGSALAQLCGCAGAAAGSLAIAGALWASWSKLITCLYRTQLRQDLGQRWAEWIALGRGQWDMGLHAGSHIPEALAYG